MKEIKDNEGKFTNNGKINIPQKTPKEPKMIYDSFEQKKSDYNQKVKVKGGSPDLETKKNITQ